MRRLEQGNRIPTYVGISLCWYSLPFAYSYDDLIESLRFPHLSSVMGCSALGPVCYCFLLLPLRLQTRLCLFSMHEHCLPPVLISFTFSSTVLQEPGSIFLFLQIAILPYLTVVHLCHRLDDAVLSPLDHFFLFVMQVPKTCRFAWHCGLENFCGAKVAMVFFCFLGICQFMEDSIGY
jgi:hypothetical protein